MVDRQHVRMRKIMKEISCRSIPSYGHPIFYIHFLVLSGMTVWKVHLVSSLFARAREEEEKEADRSLRQRRETIG